MILCITDGKKYNMRIHDVSLDWLVITFVSYLLFRPKGYRLIDFEMFKNCLNEIADKTFSHKIKDEWTRREIVYRNVIGKAPEMVGITVSALFFTKYVLSYATRFRGYIVPGSGSRGARKSWGCRVKIWPKIFSPLPFLRPWFWAEKRDQFWVKTFFWLVFTWFWGKNRTTFERRPFFWSSLEFGQKIGPILSEDLFFLFLVFTWFWKKKRTNFEWRPIFFFFGLHLILGKK